MSEWEQPNRQAASPGRQSAPEPTTDTPQEEAPENGRQAAEESVSEILQQAYWLRKEATAAYLNGTVGLLFQGHLESSAYNQYVREVLQEAGNPKDPIERMLVEQLVLAHHNIGRLHVEAAKATGTAEAELYNAAARLMAEFRKTALALKAYRLSGVSLTATAKPVAPATNQPQAASNDIPGAGASKSGTSAYDALIAAEARADAATNRPRTASDGIPEPATATRQTSVEEPSKVAESTGKPDKAPTRQARAVGGFREKRASTSRTSLYDPLLGATKNGKHAAADPSSQSQKSRGRKEESAEAAGTFS